MPEAMFMLTDSMLIFDHVRHSIVVVAPRSRYPADTDPRDAYEGANCSDRDID